MLVIRMTKSKGWNWKIVKDDPKCVWKNPSIESYYLLNRWSSLEMKNFLDLGCGLGRHTILFAQNGFNVSCFDISEEAIERTKKWCEEENLKCDYKVGDMLKLPYNDNQFDCILCRNVISHTDTEGMNSIISELKRVLKKHGECYLTLGSKDTWGFKQENWPLVDPNTRLKMEEGPEYKTPHFYADYNLCQELFKDFEIINIWQVIDYYKTNDKVYDSYHYNLIIKKH
jgi:ubiquinone/menaquinone biosynthesis C-methylase UbiE